MVQNYDDIYKIIVAGDASVGKTHLVYKIVKTNADMNNKNVGPTVGVQFSSKMMNLKDGKKIKAQIWDTAGQEQYRSITAAHYRKALGALVVYDVTKPQSFSNISKWIEGIREHAARNVVIIIVGNKIDLKKNYEEVVTTNQGKKLANLLGVFFSETSAINNENIQPTFNLLLEEIHKRMKEQGRGDYQKGFQLKKNDTQEKEVCAC